MQWLRNCWYQVGWQDEIGPAGLLARTILDEPVLVFRTEDGLLGALFDRCPHRFAPLSAGRVIGRSVRCNYHGLCFDMTGGCTDNPHGPVTSVMRVRRFPVAEKHRIIWIWMGDPNLADESAIPDLSFIDDTEPGSEIRMSLPTKANYQLIADNILDLSHVDYLHPDSLGGIMVGAKATTREIDGKVIAEWMATDCVPPPAFRAAVAPADRADIWTEVTWQAPCVMVLRTAATPTGTPREPADVSSTLHNMVPESATSSHYFVCSTRPRARDPIATERLKDMLEHAFTNEDKPMLELQQKRIGDADLFALDPILLPIDAGAIRARRRLADLIENEQASVR